MKRICHSTVVIILAGFLLILFTGLPVYAEAPMVMSTYPANGQNGVDLNLPQIILDFSKPMSNGYSINGLGPYYSGFEWSNGNQRLILTRDAGAASYQEGAIVNLTLNAPPYYSFRDTENNSLGTYFFSFTASTNSDPEAPIVVSTSPANGATNVEPDVRFVSISFNKSMSTNWSVSSYGNWQLSENTPATWSNGGRTLTLYRDNDSSLLTPLSVVRLILNPSGDGFEDTGGHVLGTYSFAFTIREPAAEEKPIVVSTNPINGATGVSQYMDWVSVNFSKAMQPQSSILCNTGNWDLAAAEMRWSSDQKTFSFSRSNAGRALPAGEICQFTLNPGETSSFRGTGGKILETYTFSFTIETPSNAYQFHKILPQDSSHDFDWPYYLSIPADLRDNPAILVEPNNTGTTTDDQTVHDLAAFNLLKWRNSFAMDLKVPLLVPTFPRPSSDWQIYTHAMDRQCLTTDIEGIERIDLQLIEMIEDAIERLGGMGIDARSKVYIMGFSASGMFTNRFTVLHPGRVLAVAIGSPGGWPIAPIASWQGETLDYHVGISDLAQLIGRPASLQAIKRVPMFLYMGDQDTNDSVPYGDSYDEAQREQVNRLFGTTPVERWPHAEAIYEAAGCNSEFKLYPGVAHNITNEMFLDIKAFFNQHSDSSPPALPSIILYLIND